MHETLIRNIGLLATPEGTAAKTGRAQGEIKRMERAAVALDGETIAWVGPDKDAPAARRTVDAGGALVTPGLVDCHTHLVFGGWRQHELLRKLSGESYLDILKSGGGILSTVAATRAATDEALFEKAARELDGMLARGVTGVEAKSGYGLELRQELRQLEIAARLDGRNGMRVVATFMGAHALPPEYRDTRAAYVEEICGRMIPAVKEQRIAAFCDVFCDDGAFTVEESRAILNRAREAGLKLKIHADEIAATGAGELAAELGAVSAEHLIAATDEGIRRMAQTGVIGVLLPCTSFYLEKPYARARDMLDAGMAVAVASDFNPGSCPCANLQLAMTTACLKYRLTPAEVLTAVTLNAAAALKLADTIGSVEPGKRADLVIWRARDLEYLCYRLGENLVSAVFAGGKETEQCQKS